MTKDIQTLSVNFHGGFATELFQSLWEISIKVKTAHSSWLFAFAAFFELAP